jgi:hypothetical protein
VSSLVGFIMDSAAVGHVESLEYVDALGGLVISHTDGGQNDFTSDTYALVSTVDGTTTPLTTSNQDTDASAYDPLADRYYSLDPNGTDWAIVDLGTGTATPAGAALDTVGDLALEPGADRIYGVDFNVNELYGFDLTNGGLDVGPATALGTVSGDLVKGLAIGPDLAPIGTSYCGPATPNSSGLPGELRAHGSDVAADNDVVLVGVQLAPSQFGMFVTSQTQGFVMPPGSQGHLCLGGAIGRYKQQLVNTGPAAAVVLPLDLTQTPTPSGPVAVQPGETWNFQLWFRDKNPGVTSNFTDAVSVAFQ